MTSPLHGEGHRFESGRAHLIIWARGLVWIGRRPSKPEIGGSNPPGSVYYEYYRYYPFIMNIIDIIYQIGLYINTNISNIRRRFVV